jgi:hypothetical protein
LLFISQFLIVRVEFFIIFFLNVDTLDRRVRDNQIHLFLAKSFSDRHNKFPQSRNVFPMYSNFDSKGSFNLPHPRTLERAMKFIAAKLPVDRLLNLKEHFRLDRSPIIVGGYKVERALDLLGHENK